MGKTKEIFEEQREKEEIQTNLEYTKAILKSGNTALKENKVEGISDIYTPMLKMLSEMEKEYNELVIKDIDKTLSKEAKDLRIRISRVRINADKARKEAKAEFLRAGNVIQGAYNTLAFAVVAKEEKLLSIEKHFENLEKEKIEKLQVERENQLTDLGIEIFPFGLGEMTIEIWNNYLIGVRIAKEQKEEAEKQAELKRVSELKAEKERIAKIEAKNKRLEKEAKEKERLQKIKQKKAEKERIKLAEIEAKKQSILNIEIEKERKAKDKLEKELQAKKDIEIKVQKEQQEKEKAQRLAPDKDKLIKLSNDLLSYSLPTLKSKEANLILNDVKILINKISNHIKDKSKTL